ncbi:crotonase/enoyl-CoA hydratase family protein [Parasphingorhabdus pacifica]
MTDGTEQRVACTVTDGVAEVRLNRPNKMNALDEPMFEELIATGIRVRDDPAIRAVVLAGAGRCFCAGLDFDRFRDMAGGATRPVAESEPIGPARATGQQAAHVWATVPVPVIAALHGAVFGGGLQIALGADIRLVAPDSELSVMEIRWGLVPDMTGSQLLPELVGRDVAKELTFTGRSLSGEEASAIGLATRVEADPLGAARKLALDIAANSPHAVRYAKHLLELAGRVGLAEGFDAEQRAIRELIASPNQVEAVRANLDARRPVFDDPPTHARTGDHLTDNPFDLTGHVAVITGGNSGIGLAMADALAAAGADVCIWGTNEERNADAAEQLAQRGTKVLPLRCDVGDEDQVEHAMAEVVDRFGRLDSCFANAGVGGRGSRFTETGLDEFRRVTRIDLDGAFLTLRAAARQLVQQGTGGSLIGTSSLAATQGQPRGQAYAASKAGLIALIKSIAIELARHDIRANAVLPGWVSTPLADPALESEAFQRRVLPRMPVGRWGKPSDFGSLAVYLASPASSFHTADTITVDGGYASF